MSIEIDSKLIRITPRKIEEAIFFARDLMATKVDEVISQQVAIGNSEFTIAVDGKTAYSRSAIFFARKNIKVNFAAGVAEIPIGRAMAALESMLMRWYPFKGEYRGVNSYKKVSLTNVSAWLQEKGKPPVEISGTSKIRLNQNQFISIALKIPSGQLNPIPLANFIRTRNNGSGIYARAARAIRRQLGVTRRNGTVRVAAVRVKSTQTLQPRLSNNKYAYNPPPKKHIPKGIAESTSWVIIIEPRRDSGQFLRS